MQGYHPNEIATMEQHKTEHRALALLRFLDRQPGNVSNECIIDVLFEKIGLICSRQETRDLLERTETLGLIRISKVDDLVVVNLLAKGEEVARGRTATDGILRPGVDCPY
jgi:hypothetical protein